jgi:hypothetical protein
MSDVECAAERCHRAFKAKGYCAMHYKRVHDHGTTEYVKPTIESRFWPKIDKSGECWLWLAGKDDKGYGQFSIGHRKIKPHRLAYELVHGPIPDGLLIDHMCHVRSCVNPAHLRAVTHKQNIENRSVSAAGVTWHKDSRKWRVQVKHHQKVHLGGLYIDREEAVDAARRLRLSLFTHNDIDRKAP